MGTRIDELNPTVLPSAEHEIVAMKDGITVKLTVGQVIGLIIAGAPTTWDTLQEIGAWIEEHQDEYAALLTALGTKAAKAANEIITGAWQFSADSTYFGADGQEQLTIYTGDAGYVGLYGRNAANTAYDTANGLLWDAVAARWELGSKRILTTDDVTWETIYKGTLASAAVHDFTNLSAYRQLRFAAKVVPGTAGSGVYLRLSSDNGVSFDATAVNYAQFDLYQNSASPAAVTAAYNTSVGVSLHNGGGNTATGLAISGLIENFNVAQETQITAQMLQLASDATRRVQKSNCFHAVNSALNAIRFVASAGNLSGFLTLEGVKS